ncbi:Crp/Fnr family transcriptional regulator [Arenicella xantha]|uniref:CRP-like cAMP-binding protein n=1 Tax=Arenicella xantha TaxID=644221 RepID=A0A395JEZ2_9GAMM|nr:Crp/Fnr family transcriptional regulator [Arenicella xantha]RBP48318.1 CRP-like cAMP-binding protein [Arenicella xantha]
MEMIEERRQKFDAIRSCPWFAVLPDTAIHTLVDRSQIRPYRSGQYLYMVGEVQRHLYCVMNGRIRINVVSSRGQEFVMANLRRGSWVGEASIVESCSRTLEAKVDEPGEMLLLPAAAVTALTKQYPLIYRCLFHETISRSKLISELMADMLFLPLKSRLAGRLLWLAENHGDVTSRGIVLKMKLSQGDFANMVMGSRQRVNKAIREWVADGVVARQGDYYLIHDIDPLLECYRARDVD